MTLADLADYFNKNRIPAAYKEIGINHFILVTTDLHFNKVRDDIENIKPLPLQVDYYSVPYRINIEDKMIKLMQAKEKEST